MVKWFGLTWAFQYSVPEWAAAVKRMTGRGREQWIERELTKIEYMQGFGLSTTARELNEGVFDENFAETIQTLIYACREIGKEAADE